MGNNRFISVAVAITGTCAVGFSGVIYAELPAPYLQVCANLPAPPREQAAPSADWLNLTSELQNFKNICDAIVVQGGDVDDTAVAALRHEEVAAQGTVAIESSRRHVSNISARLNEMRQPAYGGGSGDGDENELLESSRWGFFANGNFNKGDRTQTVGVSGSGALGDASKAVVQGERAFDFDGHDLSLGFDYRFPDEKMIMGAALGYNQQTSDFTTEDGNTDLKGYHISAYATYLPSDKTYIDGIISIGRSNIDASRPVPVYDSVSNTVLDDDGRAFADTDAQQISVSLGGGYEFNTGALNITPYTRFDYSKTEIDGYTETVKDNGSSNRDSSGMAISVGDQKIDSLVGTLGIKTSYPVSAANGVFVPQGFVELKRQFRNDDRFIEATLPAAVGVSGVTSNPSTQTSEIDRNYVRLGIGVTAVFPKGRTGFLQVESLQGSDDLSDTAIKAGYRMEF